MAPPGCERRPGRGTEAPESFAGDSTDSTANTDSSALWRALAACPDAGRRWAAIGYRIGVIDGAQAVLVKIGQAGEAVTAGFGETIKRPTVDELVDRRRGDDRPCPARCLRCSRCIRAEAAERNLRLYGSPDFPGVAAARRTA